jgi:undecaprenyl-diphosphatase
VNSLSAILLGVIQGLTEFLPVSSSAHLILARGFFGWDAEQFGLAFDVACHVGTLLAVVIFFHRELGAMLAAAPEILAPASNDARLARLIAVGTLPVVVVGLTLSDFIETSLRSPGVAAVALAVGGLAMLVAERLGRRERLEFSLTMPEALVLGVAQACALVPGVSRSGATIAVALLLGLRRDAGARFSFLLGVPAILAAAGKEALEMRHLALTPDILQLFAIGLVTSAIVGYLTIKYFLRFVAGHGLHGFAYYRFALALSVPVWMILR